MTFSRKSLSRRYKYTYPQAIYYCCILDQDYETVRFPLVKKERFSKRFPLCLLPTRINPYRTSADGLRCEYTKKN